jgi:hypothetical protein
MEVLISTFSFVGKHGLNHRQFKHFLEETEAVFGDELYYTEVSWLSRDNVVRKYSNLRA